MNTSVLLIRDDWQAWRLLRDQDVLSKRFLWHAIHMLWNVLLMKMNQLEAQFALLVQRTFLGVMKMEIMTSMVKSSWLIWKGMQWTRWPIGQCVVFSTSNQESWRMEVIFHLIGRLPSTIVFFQMIWFKTILKNSTQILIFLWSVNQQTWVKNNRLFCAFFQFCCPMWIATIEGNHHMSAACHCFYGMDLKSGYSDFLSEYPLPHATSTIANMTHLVVVQTPALKDSPI